MEEIRVYGPDNMFEFIERMCSRPTLFGLRNVEEINQFLRGYALSLSRKKYPEAHEILTKMNEFMRLKNNTGYDVEWPRFIRFCSFDDKGTIELFRNFFLEFKSTFELKKS